MSLFHTNNKSFLNDNHWIHAKVEVSMNLKFTILVVFIYSNSRSMIRTLHKKHISKSSKSTDPPDLLLQIAPPISIHNIIAQKHYITAKNLLINVSKNHVSFQKKLIVFVICCVRAINIHLYIDLIHKKDRICARPLAFQPYYFFFLN